MLSLDTVLYVFAFLCFLLDAARQTRIDANLTAMGLALLTLSLLV